MLHALLRIHPHLQGIVFDRPNVIAGASAAAGEFGLQERVTTVGGDFFQCVPGADLYLLKHILHDWMTWPVFAFCETAGVRYVWAAGSQ
jgi:hypothetical protein